MSEHTLRFSCSITVEPDDGADWDRPELLDYARELAEGMGDHLWNVALDDHPTLYALGGGPARPWQIPHRVEIDRLADEQIATAAAVNAGDLDGPEPPLPLDARVLHSLVSVMAGRLARAEAALGRVVR